MCRLDYRMPHRVKLAEPCDLTFTDREAFERHMVDVHGAKPLPKNGPSKKPIKWGPPARRPFVPKDTDHELLDWHGRVRPTELAEGDVFRYKGRVYDVEAVEEGGLFLRIRPKKWTQEKRGLVPWERFGGDDVVERLTA